MIYLVSQVTMETICPVMAGRECLSFCAVGSHTGDRGRVGDMGPKGFQGVRGPPGDIGDTGLNGTAGEMGQKGEKGIKGTQGDVGEDGELGPMGRRGPQGKLGGKKVCQSRQCDTLPLSTPATCSTKHSLFGNNRCRSTRTCLTCSHLNPHPHLDVWPSS